MSPNKKAIVVGNFNVLHPGHVRLLKFAKSIADKLVVGVYDDNLAGTNVEVQQDLRLEAVSSIECFDEAKNAFFADIGSPQSLANTNKFACSLN